ncbi:MAG TPA: zinc ribbon domain-containing protein [Pyrinomonadaceae bacterium]|nr:zinc ribbon domain-containing protein [Pyrinomonadaceae bacterium]
MEDSVNIVETSQFSPLCAACGAKLHEAKFCPECGTQAESGPARCAGCGALLEGGPKFCPECGAEQPAASHAPGG